MLDGSSNESPGVVVKGIDPFAQYHTEIQGKKEGKLTILGYLGIVIGILMIVASCSTIEGDGSGNAFGAMMGFGFMLASYFGARKK